MRRAQGRDPQDPDPRRPPRRGPPSLRAVELADLDDLLTIYKPDRSLGESPERSIGEHAELVDAIAAGAPDTLSGGLREAWRDAPDDVAHWRVVIDQVAALTDQQAYAWHARLVRPS